MRVHSVLEKFIKMVLILANVTSNMNDRVALVSSILATLKNFRGKIL